MTDILRISKVNETYIRVECVASVAMELSDHFTFMIPNAKFHLIEGMAHDIPAYYQPYLVELISHHLLD